MGPAQADGWAGVDAGRAFGLGPGRKVLFFSNLFLVRKPFQKNLEIV
jgi:hypothetical protein